MIRRLGLIVVAIAASGVANWSLWVAASGSAGASPLAATPSPATGYPLTPPAAVCGNSAALAGPATLPAGAVQVDPGTDLAAVTKAHGPGTTFWLSPGTFTLPATQFSQVAPKDNDVYIGAPGAVLDGQGVNRFAFGQGAPGVTIEYLTVQNFAPPVNQAAVNPGGTANWTLAFDTIQTSASAGVNLGPNGVVHDSCISGNGQLGIKALGASNVTIDHNEISGNVTGQFVGMPCGCTAGIKLFSMQNATVTNNWIHNNQAKGVWGDTNVVGILIEGNYINDNSDEAIFYEASYNGFIHNNNIIRNALVKGAKFSARQDTFPIGAVYISESGGDSRVNGGVYSTFEIAGNNLDNNYGGVTLWENANRFCNTATPTVGYCPIAGSGTVSTCVAGSIDSPPLIDDCRWKTQNVLVDNNTFRIDKTALGCEGTRCGEVSLFSNLGVRPSWSPYLGTEVQDAITYSQNNHFSNNTYIGDWNADAYAQGQTVTFAQWQAAPYNQDARSTLVPLPNALDADTSGLEGSIGWWKPWYNAAIAQSPAEAHTGTESLQIAPSKPNWGVTLATPRGFPTGPGSKTVSLWGLSTTPGNDHVMLNVTWRSSSGGALQVDSVALPPLSGSWQEASALLTAPPGTASVSLALVGAKTPTGSTLYVDDVAVTS
ncbi:MAG: right-handed parallel beta-helix repeat-containing protein [Acidimicrobiales bacterium]